MKVFLHLTDATFDSALSYMRQLKADGRNVAVFSANLNKENNRKKIGELGFTLLEGDPYFHLANEPGMSAFVIEFKKPLLVWIGQEGKDKIFYSGISGYDLEQITQPIGNILQRVNVANLLEKKLGKNLLATEYIVAPQDFWKLMYGVHKKWVDELYFNSVPVAHDLLFNFCIAFYDKTNMLLGDNNQ